MREKAKLSVRSKKWALRWLSIGIILILISCVGASVLQTNFYKTQVYTFKAVSYTHLTEQWTAGSAGSSWGCYVQTDEPA